MANGVKNQENLRIQLAVAVRSVQWSYAIFWSLSTRQQGLLEWGDGYYNGDIKTRKTVQAMELKPDKMGLERSEQLRELYKCLLDGKADQQDQRPSSAALSPDDLSDAEWYYLVCMSFVFNPGQGLPGRALVKDRFIWLCDAHCADSKVFSRSLLAKSASIQTVICFPHLDGVIELGVTDLVLENPNLIQHIKASLLEFSKPHCSKRSTSAPQNRDDDIDDVYAKVDHETVHTMTLENFYSPTEDIRFDQEGLNELDGNIQDDFTIGSPGDDCSNEYEHNHQTDDSFLFEGFNGDDDFSNCIHDSMNSSDCISQVFVNQENVNHSHLKEFQGCNPTKLSSLDLGTTDDYLHYRRILSVVLSNSHRLLDNLYFQNCSHKSSFVSWRKGEICNGHRPQVHQKMLKKILFDVPLMQGDCYSHESQQENGINDWLLKPENDEIHVQHVCPDKRIENEKFLVLGSMVPSINKIDKELILGDAIEYLKVLEARIDELESCTDLPENDGRAARKYPDVIEHTSDNYEGRTEKSSKRWMINKRKASDYDDTNTELSGFVPKDGPILDMKVNINEQEVAIEMRCPWREHLLFDIIEAMNSLHLDAHTVQSSTVDGILTVTLQSKFQGAAVASARMIKQALSTIAGKC